MLWACFQFDADLIGVHSKNHAITDWVLRVVSAEHAVLLFSESPTGFSRGIFPIVMYLRLFGPRMPCSAIVSSGTDRRTVPDTIPWVAQQSRLDRNGELPVNADERTRRSCHD